MTETIRSKTIKKSGNFRYLCPACDNPAIHPVTLPFKNYTCPNSGSIVTVAEIKSSLRLPYVYDNK